MFAHARNSKCTRFARRVCGNRVINWTFEVAVLRRIDFCTSAEKRDDGVWQTTGQEPATLGRIPATALALPLKKPGGQDFGGFAAV